MIRLDVHVGCLDGTLKPFQAHNGSALRPSRRIQLSTQADWTPCSNPFRRIIGCRFFISCIVLLTGIKPISFRVLLPDFGLVHDYPSYLVGATRLLKGSRSEEHTSE